MAGHIYTKIVVTLAVAACVCSTPAWADAVIQQAKLLPDDGAAGDEFGSSVSLDGDTVVVGAQGDRDNGYASGSAYVFVRSGGGWTQQTKLLPDDGAWGDSFGKAVSLDGDTVVVGAWGDDDNGSKSGSAYVFVRNSGVWTQEAKLLPDDGAAGDRFYQASVDGNTVVVGAFGDDDNGSGSGSAYVFVRSGGVWTQEAKLLPDDGAAGELFGIRVSLDGNTVVVGAPQDDHNGGWSGSAYVFVRSDGVWTQEAKLLADDGSVADHFGDSVTLDGDTVVVGARYTDDNGENSGSAYVFVRSGGVWTQEAKLLADDFGGRFGDSVTLDGDTVVVSAWGSAYFFVRSDGVWTQEAKLLPDDGARGRYVSFGRSVSLDGDTVVVGARYTDDNGHLSGSAYVFRSLAGLIDGLIETVVELNLQHGIENSTDDKLSAATEALTAVNDDNEVAAISALDDFIRATRVQSGRDIPKADADMLIEAAEEIIGLLMDSLAPTPILVEPDAP